jgi:two-component system, OmpR family, response regulator RegX3
MSASVLVVDDEPAIRDAVTYALEREGFSTRTADDGPSALDLARSEPFDLVVLDLMLPRLSGTEVCRALRSESAVPIIMLTARSTEIDRVIGLELGADDYVVKPFSVMELVSRVKAILRRRELDRGDGAGAVRRIGSLTIDLMRHEVSVDGGSVHVTPSEFRMLEKLSEEPGRAYGRRELLRHLWRSEHVGDERACDAHVVNLRRKLERGAAPPVRLVTVRGVGYALRPD